MFVGGLWGQKKEGAQTDRGVLPSLSGMMPLSLSGSREGMVSFPAGSSLWPGLPVQTISPPKGALQKGKPFSPCKCISKN